jgi:hypothetical protein
MCLIPAILSFLLLAAHFLRSGNLPFVALSLSMIPLLLVPRRWARITAQTVLVLGAIEWLFTMNELVSTRVAEHEPWLRGMIILLSVAAFTMLAAVLLRWRATSRRKCSAPA